MRNTRALLTGAALFGGLAFAHAGWAQATAQTPGTVEASQPGQAGAQAGQPGAATSGQTGAPAPGQSGAPAPGQTGPAAAASLLPLGKITRIDILGTKNVSAGTVRAAITEKAGDRFDPAAAERDRQAISALGFWAGPAQLADISDAQGGVDLTFSVIENPVVQGVRFNANTLTGEPTIPSATLLSLMATRPGQVLNTNTLQSDLAALFDPDTGYARRQGYRFQVGSSINIDPTTGVLSIPVVEDYVQAVLVSGRTKTPTADILNALPLKAGDLYNDRTVATQTSPGRDVVKRVRIAGPARVEPMAPGRVAITVPVTEGR